MKPLFLLSLLFLSLSLFSAEIKGKVVAVYDGDTITVLDKMDKGNFKIRLDKIDAPEKKQAFGSKAKQFLSSLIFGKQVTVRYKAVDPMLYADAAKEIALPRPDLKAGKPFMQCVAERRSKRKFSPPASTGAFFVQIKNLLRVEFLYF